MAKTTPGCEREKNAWPWKKTIHQGVGHDDHKPLSATAQAFRAPVASFDVELSQDAFNAAFDYLETVLEDKIFRFDIDDMKGLVQQVYAEGLC